MTGKVHVKGFPQCTAHIGFINIAKCLHKITFLDQWLVLHEESGCHLKMTVPVHHLIFAPCIPMISNRGQRLQIDIGHLALYDFVKLRFLSQI